VKESGGLASVLWLDFAVDENKGRLSDDEERPPDESECAAEGLRGCGGSSGALTFSFGDDIGHEDAG